MALIKWLFIGTDQRLLLGSEMFKERGCDVRYFPANEWNEELRELLEQWKPNHIVFPILQMDGQIPLEYLQPDVRLYTGVATEEWKSLYKELFCKSYLHDQQFVWRNAVLTAEAFIREFYASTAQSIANKHFYVTGFGKVAKATAQVLSGLAATVTIAARSPEQLGEAAALGYQTMPLNEGVQFREGFIVNTIPAQWLHPAQSNQLRIFDLASKPGCLKQPLSSEYYTLHLGLPGKHFPADAADALVEALLRMSN